MHNLRTQLLAICSVSLILSFPIYAAKPTHNGKVVLFGNLHAHSSLSDDVDANIRDKMHPKTAFKYAHDHGLDFLAITDHHKGNTDNSTSSFLKIKQNEYKKELYDVAMKYNQDNQGEFIAIPGIEWGTIKTGNHVNLFGIKTLPTPSSIKDHQYKKLYNWAQNKAEFIQFNHPNSWGSQSGRNKSVGNFGQAQYTSDKTFVEATDDLVKTISIITTVYGGHISGKYAHYDSKTHREAGFETTYKKYLNMGFHVSPSANQDTHYTNWGAVTAARTAVWADSVSYEDLMKAFRANRVYATEDDEMVVVYQVKYKNKVHWMGETLELGADSANVELRVKVWQATGSDSDNKNEGPYTIEILSDYDGIGKRQAAVWDTHENVESNHFTKWEDLEVVAGEYIYVRVTEENGKDNSIGDGEDKLNNNTGDFGSDGKRDNMNDSAWTSPIWFVN